MDTKRCMLLSLLFFLMPAVMAQMNAPAPTTDARAEEIREIRQELDVLSRRLAALEASENSAATPAPGTASVPVAAAKPAEKPAVGSAAPVASATPAANAASVAGVPPAVSSSPAATPTVLQPADAATLAFFRGTTLNFGVDGYYGRNFNSPVGRVNQLRAYDVTSNSFNLNQATVMVEHLPTTEERFGGRLDLQFGQAPEATQGSSANEQRPQVWRNLFQAYGSYLAPVGSGLQIDFGKWASALGNESNYTKDQIAYSRAYSFDFLPFYHMGLRANYNLTPKVNVAYWLVNGVNDTEDLNGFKSQAFLFTLKPASTLTWNVNYYFGQEARDVLPTSGGGLPTTNIVPTPNGREHIFDTYATWNATPKLTLIGEADFVVNRTYAEQRPERVAIGGFAFKYALPHDWSVGGRAEYFDDRSGLFSGKTQALKEGTVVLDHLFARGFLARAEYRHDWSNQRFFNTDTPGVLVPAQSTATLGLVYWWGMKQGAW